MSRTDHASALLAFLFVVAAPAAAQESILSVDAIDVSYVTDDHIAAVVVHPDRILKSKALAALPLDAVVASAKDSLGIDLRQVRRATILIPTPGPGRDPDAIVGVIQFNNRVDAKKIVSSVMATKAGPSSVEEHTVRDKKILSPADGPPIGYYFPNAQTAVIAELDQFDGLLSARGGSSALAKKLVSHDTAHAALAVIDMAPLRELLEAASTVESGPDAAMISAGREVLSQVEFITLAVDMGDNLQIAATIEARDAEAAELVQDLARGWLGMMKIAAPAVVKEMRNDPTMDATLKDNLEKLANTFMKEVRIERHDDRVEIAWSAGGDDALLASTLMSTGAHLRDAARITESSNNLRQLGIAVHLHADIHRELFPARAIYDADGKPLLSWRVHLLPFMERQDLYEEFHLDEPWDSEHNKKLIAEMPAVFKSPTKDLGDGKTCYLAVVAENSVFPLKDLPTGERARQGQGVVSFGSVIDGLSNTMMFIEAAPEEAVIWTKPDDWELDPENPRKGLFGMQRGFVLAAFGDASVRRVPEKAGDEAIIRAVGRNDRQPYEFEETERGRDEEDSFRKPADPPPSSRKAAPQRRGEE